MGTVHGVAESPGHNWATKHACTQAESVQAEVSERGTWLETQGTWMTLKNLDVTEGSSKLSRVCGDGEEAGVGMELWGALTF